MVRGRRATAIAVAVMLTAAAATVAPVPVAHAAATPAVWTAATDGGVFATGGGFFGSMGGHALDSPVVSLAATPTGRGYWLAALDGGVFAFGDARFFGSMGGRRLNQPVVAMASTPTGRGYWLAALDGGVFAFGDARFFGSMGGRRLNQPVVAMASTRSGRGYWLVAADGGIFAFGDARFFGSMGGRSLDQPVATIGATASGRGYWLAGRDGGVFAFGDAPFLGAAAPAASPAVGIVRSATGRGYWIAHADDRVDAFGDASPIAAHIVRAPVVGIATPWASSSGYALVLIEELRRPVRTWPAAHEVALTFDDGPSAYTQQVVDTLRRYGVTATFFAVGYQLSARASAVRAAVAAGDAVEVHSWDHAQLTRLDATEIATELRTTADAIYSLTGERPRCFRPPYGATNPTVLAVGRSLGLTQVLWNVDPSDYLRPGASVIASRVVAAATGRGLVVGIHDGGGDRSQTVAALPAIITGLRAHGYRFVRLCP